MIDTKPAIASTTIWAALLALIPLVGQGIDALSTSGIILPPKIAAVVSALSGALVIIRRVTNKDIKPIKGVVSNG